MILTLSPRLTNLSSIFLHLLIIIPVPSAVLLVPALGLMALKMLRRRTPMHNLILLAYGLIPT